MSQTTNELRACPRCGFPDELALDSNANAEASWIECGNCGYRLQLPCDEESLADRWNALSRASMPIYDADALPPDPPREVSAEERALRDACNYWYERAKTAEAKLASRHEQAQGGMAWMPIETAPKGLLILYYPAESGRNSKCEMVRTDHYPVGYPRKPTHWMPLPEPPTRPTADARQETQG